jgi:ABC-type multidrug transport system fused ATPase/permease subunit
VPRFVHNVSDLIRRYGPSLLILDETTRALDMATEAKLPDVLRGLMGRFTMVVATHRLSAVANCCQLIDLANEIFAVAAFHAN